jgi:hypothetical protein
MSGADDPRDDHLLQPSEYRARLPPVGKHRGVGMRGRFGVVPGVVCLVAGLTGGVGGSGPAAPPVTVPPPVENPSILMA